MNVALVAIVAMLLAFFALPIGAGVGVRQPAAPEEIVLYIDPPPANVTTVAKTGREDVVTVAVDDIKCFYVGPTLPDRNPLR